MPLNGASSSGTEPPKNGDLTVCIYCSAILMFVNDDKFYLLNLEDIKQLSIEEKIAVMQALRVVRHVQKLRHDLG